jgi:hypothetical protein
MAGAYVLVGLNDNFLYTAFVPIADDVPCNNAAIYSDGGARWSRKSA